MCIFWASLPRSMTRIQRLCSFIECICAVCRNTDKSPVCLYELIDSETLFQNYRHVFFSRSTLCDLPSAAYSSAFCFKSSLMRHVLLSKRSFLSISSYRILMVLEFSSYAGTSSPPNTFSSQFCTCKRMLTITVS